MSPNVREWLPGDALDCGAVPVLVAGAVETWASKWFVRAEVRASGFAARRSGADRRPAGWQVAKAVGTALSASDTVRLAGLALGVELERLVLSEADRDIIGSVAAEIAGDLAVAIEAALGLDPAGPEGTRQADDPFTGDGGLQFGIIAQGDRPLVDVAIPSFALVPFRKSAIPSARRRGAPLAAIAGTVETTMVRVAARLGTAVLPLGELAGLAAGDVLVLDRAIEDGAELSFRPRGRPFARGSIVSGGSEFALLLLPQQRNA